MNKGRPNLHGMSYSRFYRIFSNIKRKCNSPSHSKYKYYGGRGIKFIWTSFDEFKKDMYDDYIVHLDKNGKKNTTIDRIDNDGHYCKENCRWATMKQQENNRSNNINIMHSGEKKYVIDAAKIVGCSLSTIYTRLKLGRSWDKIISTPVESKYANNRGKKC